MDCLLDESPEIRIGLCALRKFSLWTRHRKAVHPDMTRKASEVFDFLRQRGMGSASQVEAEKFLARVGNEIGDTAVWYQKIRGFLVDSL